MAAAARRYGREVLVDDDSRAVPDDRESAGRRLLQLVFGSGGAGPDVPPLVAGLIEDPGSQQLLAGLTAYADEVLESDPGKAARAAGVIAGFYRGQAAAGRVEALVDLGDLLTGTTRRQRGPLIRRRLTPGMCPRCSAWRKS